MKKILFSVLAAMAMIVVSCKPDDPVVTPEQPDDPDTPGVVTPDEPDEPEGPDQPVEPEFVDNVIYVVSADGSVSREIPVKSATSCVISDGYVSFYLGSMEGLNPSKVENGYSPKPGESIIGAAVLGFLKGKKVEIGEEKLRHILQASLDGMEDISANNSTVSDNVKGGWFCLDVDTGSSEARFEMEINLNDGSRVKVAADAKYVAGNENETFVVLGDSFSNIFRVGFYDEPVEDGFNETLYLAVGKIEYGEEINRTSFVGIAPHASICDGEPHDIAECVAAEKLYVMFYTIDDYSTWSLTSGQITIKKRAEHDYEISILGANAMDEDFEYEDRAFDMYWEGSLKDMSVKKPVYSQLEFNGKKTPLLSAVIDRTGDVAYIYLCPSEGLTTVEAAESDTPVIITVSAEKVFTNVGLSTDRQNFSISYKGNVWDSSNLDTCSYIVEDYDGENFHCRIANFSLQSGKTSFRLEYSGPVTVIE